MMISDATTPPKFNILPLINGGWKITFKLGRYSNFSGENSLLNFGAGSSGSSIP